MTVHPLPVPQDRLPGLAGNAGLDEAAALMVRLAVGSRLDRVGAIAQEHLLTGGKRMRARLALAAAEALGLERTAAVPWAAACELLHQASLVHDDVQDGDRTRRGHVAVWAHHGVAAAINTGDLLLMLPWLAIDELRAPSSVQMALVRATAERAADTVRGQGRDLDLLASERLDRSDWEVAAHGKSGALLALPVEGAALLAGLESRTCAALAEPFATLGVLYQACDDITDLYGDKGRGAVGNDLREGKVSLLVVEHLRLHPQDRAALLATLRRPRAETTDAEVAGWIERFRDGGALAACLSLVDAYEARITGDPRLRSVPDLHEVASELVARIRKVSR
ncbi:MAG: polyprenyl synthetase family protein [Myxococcales bacterium]|nr:polyprenyl synthetase family protein [Myxococcales bacterium]